MDAMDGRNQMLEPIMCYCGRPSIQRTSWTENNPGRRFNGCEKYMNKSIRGCGFFVWHDPPMCHRSRQIIPGLLRGMSKLEKEKRWLRRIVILQFVGLMICVMLMYNYIIGKG